MAHEWDIGTADPLIRKTEQPNKLLFFTTQRPTATLDMNLKEKWFLDVLGNFDLLRYITRTQPGHAYQKICRKCW
jgi:hypothetical protein